MLKPSMSALSLAQGRVAQGSQLRRPGLSTTTTTSQAEGGGYEARKYYREVTREFKMPRGTVDRLIRDQQDQKH